MTEVRNLAASAGRWSAQHRKLAIWGWIAVTLLVFMVGSGAGTVAQENAQSGVGESGRASVTLDKAFPKHVSEEVLIQSGGVRATDPKFKEVVADVQRRLTATPYTRAFESPYAPGNAARVSRDGHSALLRFELAGSEKQAKDRVEKALAATHAAQVAHPGFDVAEFGEASTEKEISDAVSKDFKRALFTSLPITLIILLITFGALVAASIPLLLAITAVLGTIGVVALISHLSPVDESINEVILLIGPRGGGRLFDVLPAPRARRARARSRRAGFPRGRGRDFGARGARLRLHSDDRHGGHVPRRRAHI